MFNSNPMLEMTTMFEKLRLQLRFRELKTRLGEDQALSVVEEALRLEFASDREISRPENDHVGSKKLPVAA